MNQQAPTPRVGAFYVPFGPDVSLRVSPSGKRRSCSIIALAHRVRTWGVDCLTGAATSSSGTGSSHHWSRRGPSRTETNRDNSRC